MLIALAGCGNNQEATQQKAIDDQLAAVAAALSDPTPTPRADADTMTDDYDAARYKALIVGTWQAPNGQISTFFANGIQANDSPTAWSCWLILEGDVLAETTPSNGANSTTTIISIDATTMELKEPTQTRFYTRIDTDGTLTAAEQAEAEKQQVTACPAP